jgi:hypothetical protein
MSKQPTAVLLDANLLLLISVGRFNRTLIGHKRLDVFSTADFDLLIGMIATYPRSLTTPHLLAEVNNLSDQCIPKPHHREFRQFLRKFWLGLDERWTKSTELAETPTFLQLGLSDAAICKLAEERTLIISVDAELCSVLWGLGSNALNFNHYR